ncbi:MAG: 50S ribosomal protein L6 [Kofleriaceae bacterium]|nr:50S ribosomal protein L6 [Kofleriaceae bacterium]
MSRIGNNPVKLPKGVDVTLGPVITVKGPKGELTTKRNDFVNISQGEGKVVFERAHNSRPARAAHGLMRALVANMVHGVTMGFERKLEINGIGYRAEVAGQKMTLQLGFSHPVIYDLPKGIKAKVEKNIIILSGIDKQALGASAAKIRSFRPPEPYKGKGVKYLEERILRKAGKAAG